MIQPQFKNYFCPIDNSRYNDYILIMPNNSTGKVPEVITPMREMSGKTAAATEAYLEIMRTSEALRYDLEELLKEHGLSSTQYNVLRILRGAGVEGFICQEISCSMVNRDPDMTRLLDRLEKRGLVLRARSEKDRRVIRTYLTEEGLRLIELLDDPVAQLHLRQLGSLDKKQMRGIASTLKTVRASLVAGRCPGES